MYEQEYRAYCTCKVVLTSKHREAGTFSQNHQVWKRPLRPFSPTVHTALPLLPLNHHPAPDSDTSQTTSGTILPPPCEIMPSESHTSRNMLTNCMELRKPLSFFNQLTDFTVSSCTSIRERKMESWGTMSTFVNA